MYDGKIELIKARTEENLADVLTKAVDGNNLSWHIENINAWTTKDRQHSCQSWIMESWRRNSRMKSNFLAA